MSSHHVITWRRGCGLWGLSDEAPGPITGPLLSHLNPSVRPSILSYLGVRCRRVSFGGDTGIRSTLQKMLCLRLGPWPAPSLCRLVCAQPARPHTATPLAFLKDPTPPVRPCGHGDFSEQVKPPTLWDAVGSVRLREKTLDGFCLFLSPSHLPAPVRCPSLRSACPPPPAAPASACPMSPSTFCPECAPLLSNHTCTGDSVRAAVWSGGVGDRHSCPRGDARLHPWTCDPVAWGKRPPSPGRVWTLLIMELSEKASWCLC